MNGKNKKAEEMKRTNKREGSSMGTIDENKKEIRDKRKQRHRFKEKNQN